MIFKFNRGRNEKNRAWIPRNQKHFLKFKSCLESEKVSNRAWSHWIQKKSCWGSLKLFKSWSKCHYEKNRALGSETFSNRAGDLIFSKSFKS